MKRLKNFLFLLAAAPVLAFASTTVHLDKAPVNGAEQRIGRSETAFSYRDVTWAEVIVGVDPDPAN